MTHCFNISQIFKFYLFTVINFFFESSQIAKIANKKLTNNQESSVLQATIDSLQEEVAAQQHRAEVTGKQLEARLGSLQQQAKAATLQDASEEVHLLKQELETVLKVGFMVFMLHCTW